MLPLNSNIKPIPGYLDFKLFLRFYLYGNLILGIHFFKKISASDN